MSDEGAVDTAQFVDQQCPEGHRVRRRRGLREGSLPATGSVAALIGRATGVEPHYVGTPNPLMMR